MASKHGLRQLLLLTKSLQQQQKHHRTTNMGLLFGTQKALAGCDPTAESSSLSLLGIRKRRFHDTPFVALSSDSSSSGDGGAWNQNQNDNDPHAMFKEQMEQLKLEREELYGFTDEERGAWSNGNNSRSGASSDRLSPSLMTSVQEARQQEANKNTMSSFSYFSEEVSTTTRIVDNDKPHLVVADNVDLSLSSQQPSSSYHGLTHLSEDGSTATMVDVGPKSITRRMARAQTTIILPPEVIQALHLKCGENEVVGPKGAVFATARMAGIMAAK
jgi:MoaC family